MSKGSSYLRFSKPPQGLGDSKRRQLDGTAKWAAEVGVELVDHYSDLGISAFRGQNRRDTADLARFLELVRLGKIERGHWLFIECLDRLSREEVLTALNLFTSL